MPQLLQGAQRKAGSGRTHLSQRLSLNQPLKDIYRGEDIACFFFITVNRYKQLSKQNLGVELETSEAIRICGWKSDFLLCVQGIGVPLVVYPLLWQLIGFGVLGDLLELYGMYFHVCKTKPITLCVADTQGT